MRQQAKRSIGRCPLRLFNFSQWETEPCRMTRKGLPVSRWYRACSRYCRLTSYFINLPLALLPNQPVVNDRGIATASGYLYSDLSYIPNSIFLQNLNRLNSTIVFYPKCCLTQ